MNDKNFPDFSNSVDYDDGDGGKVSTIQSPDFSNSVDYVEPQPIKKRNSVITEVVRFLTKGSVIDQYESALYLANNPPESDPNINPEQYANEAYNILSQGVVGLSGNYSKNRNAPKKREQDIIASGIEGPAENLMSFGIITQGYKSPLGTSLAVGGFTALDSIINFRDKYKELYPNNPPEVDDLVTIADYFVKGLLLGGAGYGAKKMFNKTISASGSKPSVDIPSDKVSNIKNSQILLPEEKADILRTIGADNKHVDAAIGSSLPLNIKADSLVDLAQKPYWERLKEEILLSPVIAWDSKMSDKEWSKLVKEARLKSGRGEDVSSPQPSLENKQDIIARIKSLQESKKLSNVTVSKLKKYIGIENIKTTQTDKLKQLESFLGDLKKEDKFMSEKQITDLKDIIKDIPNPEVTPKRIIVEKFGEKEEVLSKGLFGKVMNELIPTVDIKQGSPLITKIVNKANDVLSFAQKEIDRRNMMFEELISRAEKSREKLLSPQDKILRKITPQNKEIFSAMSGNKVNLTKEEAAVVAYLKNFFRMTRRELELEKYRKNYITHMEKDLTEKILTRGINNTIKDILGGRKEGDIPTDLMLELDNIIGSEKFFKFALERKGGIDPTTNIRQIINSYSSLFETKKALDQILPEGQAIVKNLLKGKNALWMKRYLQNLKGRGLDYNFRNGKMGWLAKVADGVIDIGYQKLLGFNYISPLKNIVAGESNSWIFQDFKTYLTGKQRFLSNPKKAYTLAKEYGLLDGTYAEFSQKGIGKLKKLQDLSMIGQRAGEVEIRSSIFASMLSEGEWSSGKIAKEKILDIKDTIAITQGIFSKTESPLFLQTWYGRMFFQMNRWRITNIMLLRRISVGAYKDISEGNYNTANVTRLGKMIAAYGIGMYISYQMYEAGYKEAGDIAKNTAQTLDGVFSLFTEAQLIKMFTDNPTLQMFKELSSTIQDFTFYLYVPGSKPSKERGIEDTYIAPLKTYEDVADYIEENIQ